MNTIQGEILILISGKANYNQRELAEEIGCSLGIINSHLKRLKEEGYLDTKGYLTAKSRNLIEQNKPKRAIILAAGFGMRMVPINMEAPKGLLEVRNEPLIERLIKQLKEKNIHEIHIVTGFMKEAYDYLIDDYGVNLIYNSEYSTRNNNYSLYVSREYLDDAYIIPCDIWCKRNPFRDCEIESWYMVENYEKEEQETRTNRKRQIIKNHVPSVGNRMVGIGYITRQDACVLRNELERIAITPQSHNDFWEEALFRESVMYIPARMINKDTIFEINTYEQLRELDEDSGNLRNDYLDVITSTLNKSLSDIRNVRVLKKGMTNRSFIFSCDNKKYIMRIPGEGTDKLINRQQEAEVYTAISGFGISDKLIHIDPGTGVKITEYIEGGRTCDTRDNNDLAACMRKLRGFHDLRLQVGHTFDIFERIEYYERLWEGKVSIYRDYQNTKENIWKLKRYIDEAHKDICLTHIDAVPDNFLIMKTGELFLIDWEYAAMQDPHVDIAMFAIYSLYDRHEIDHLIDIYFDNMCDRNTRIKIYCYVAACGLLWSNWCEYKRGLGVEFGEYSVRQYRYAKDYYRIVQEELT